jgi:hypothetical protein
MSGVMGSGEIGDYGFSLPLTPTLSLDDVLIAIDAVCGGE